METQKQHRGCHTIIPKHNFSNRIQTFLYTIMVLKRIQTILFLSFLHASALEAFSPQAKTPQTVAASRPSSMAPLNVGAMWVDDPMDLPQQQGGIETQKAQNHKSDSSNYIKLFHLMRRAVDLAKSAELRLDDAESCLEDLLVQQFHVLIQE